LRAAAEEEHRGREQFKPVELEGMAVEGLEDIVLERRVSRVFLTREVEVEVPRIVETEQPSIPVQVEDRVW
jgi:hypothetical protein